MEQNDNQNLPPSALCRNGCGFYGNASFDGMCSKCFKDALKRKQNTSSAGGRMSPTTSATPSDMSSIMSSSPSVETASPTVPSPVPQDKGEEKEEGAIGGNDAATADDDSSSMSGESSSGKTPKKKNRCFTCKKKVGLTGFECRCGGLYCGLHRYSDKHECNFNYKEHAQVQLRKLNPVIVGEKIQKI